MATTNGHLVSPWEERGQIEKSRFRSVVKPESRQVGPSRREAASANARLVAAQQRRSFLFKSPSKDSWAASALGNFARPLLCQSRGQRRLPSRRFADEGHVVRETQFQLEIHLRPRLRRKDPKTELGSKPCNAQRRHPGAV